MYMDCKLRPLINLNQWSRLNQRNTNNSKYLQCPSRWFNWFKTNLNQPNQIKFNFLNTYDKNKMRTWKFLFISFEHFGERIKIKWLEMNKSLAKICSEN